MTKNQQKASNPAISAWVSAHAGTGKTKVLTDRVLRLLLAGAPPARILCMTFTKPAAAEMTARVQDHLRAWAVMEDGALTETLTALMDEAPDALMKKRARRLFAEVLETPDGLRIQTLHSLCQSLLRRFPLEARTQPHFTVIDERTASDLLKDARMRLFSQSREQEDPRLAEAIRALASNFSEFSFAELLDEIIRHRRRLSSLLKRPSGIIRLNTDLWQSLGFAYRTERRELFGQHFAYGPQELAELKAVAKRCCDEGSEKDILLGESTLRWLEKPCEDSLLAYQLSWLTQKNEPRKNVPSSAMMEALGEHKQVAVRECERLIKYIAAVQSLEIARLSEYVMDVAEALLVLYSHLKSVRAFLDYDDLILLTRDLLRRSGIAPWVLYKLDGGLDHVLIDEAQDTSPEQWQIVQALVSDFFAGATANETVRTLFVVGDEKQSIYSFQGADPAEFLRMRQYFSQKIAESGETFEHVTLSHSFRSTQAVLKAVDAVFALPVARQGAMAVEEDIRHEITRLGAAGKVEIWPVVEPMAGQEFSPWSAATLEESGLQPSVQLAERIATEIRQWIDQKKILPARGRPIEPGDIMILVRKRGQFMAQMVSALKARNIPVAGVDRLVLTEHIAVMDLMALGHFLLLPEDDLNLAALLKSPLFGLNEEQLFALAYKRGELSLWQRLLAKKHEQKIFASTVELLTELLGKTDYVAPYELFAYVLYGKDGLLKWMGRLGEECRDPIQEFLALALQYEAQFPPSLQGFLDWLVAGDVEIKRDAELRRNEVQVMTVHGAKGLQAPIVFLPDTVNLPKAQERLHWYEDEPLQALLMGVKEDLAPPFVSELKQMHKDAMMREYMRLLYVAMTRAEDQLFVAGWKGKRDKVSDVSWYGLISQALAPMTEEIETVSVDGEVLTLRRMEETQQKEAIPQDGTGEHRVPDLLPGWIRVAPPDEPHVPSPLSPSRMDGEPPVISPHVDQLRFQRGRVLHRLLQYLPDVAVGERRELGLAFLARQKDVSEADHAPMVDEVLRVLTHPEFAPVFGTGSAAEVPVSGKVQLEGRVFVLSGQIDRLYVSEKEVWIVDYKTQRQPPKDVGAVPEGYIRQMAAYRKLIEGVYPGKTVHCGLLYTAGPVLLPLPAIALARLDVSAA